MILSLKTCRSRDGVSLIALAPHIVVRYSFDTDTANILKDADQKFPDGKIFGARWTSTENQPMRAHPSLTQQVKSPGPYGPNPDRYHQDTTLTLKYSERLEMPGFGTAITLRSHLITSTNMVGHVFLCILPCKNLQPHSQFSTIFSPSCPNSGNGITSRECYMHMKCDSISTANSSLKAKTKSKLLPPAP